MRVILTQTIESLGIIGSEVEVKAGYARNFLLPQKMALVATPENRRRLDSEKSKFELQIAKERKLAEEMAQRLEGVACRIVAKVAEEDRLYGSVGVRDIIDALAAQNIVVEKRMVLLTEPIKQLGSFKIPIRVYKGVEPEITLEVVSEG
jgi:large subunit ribosomal protein L9